MDEHPRPATVSLPDFLNFEQTVFGDPLLIPEYDPYLIRYGEYRFVLDELRVAPGDVIVDVGCEANILCLFLASLGSRVIAVDVDADAGELLRQRRERTEALLGRPLDLTFHLGDATQLELAPASADAVVAVSSVEHMFSPDGDGDQLAMAEIARLLKPGGSAVMSVPMSNGGPFREVPTGDEQFGAPYRLYDLESLERRLLSQPDLSTASLRFLAQDTPDDRFDPFHFFKFWTHELEAADRARWAWATPILSEIFNPRVTSAHANAHPSTLNTALARLTKRG